MDVKYTTEQVFNNPYLLEAIVSRLDIRTLQKCSTISKEFHDAVVYEIELRNDIKHLHLTAPHIERLNQLFLDYTEHRLNIRTNNVLIFVGGYRDSLDYRRARHRLRRLGKHLPKHCAITYIDVGIFMRYSLIMPYSLFTLEHYNQIEGDMISTPFPIMSCLLFPDMDGIDMRVYTDFKQISTDGVKCVLYFEASKQRQQYSDHTQDSQLNQLIHKLGYRVAFGGGSPKAIKTMDKSSSRKDDVLRRSIILTFGGRRVRASSVVLPEQNDSQYLSELTSFRNGLDFDCNDKKQSKSFAFLFENSNTITPKMSLAFHSVFPFAILFGFESDMKMYGHCYSPLITDTVYPNGSVSSPINTNVKSVLVVINFSHKRDV